MLIENRYYNRNHICASSTVTTYIPLLSSPLPPSSTQKDTDNAQHHHGEDLCDVVQLLAVRLGEGDEHDGDGDDDEVHDGDVRGVRGREAHRHSVQQPPREDLICIKEGRRGGGEGGGRGGGGEEERIREKEGEGDTNMLVQTH